MSSENKQIGYNDIFKNKEYMKLIIANLINRFGDALDSIAFMWIVYAITKSASLAALIFGLNQLPTVIFQPFTGAKVATMNKKTIMIISDVFKGLLTLIFFFLYITNTLNFLYIAIFTMLISTADAFRVPCSTAIIPKLLEEKSYEFGISLDTSISAMMQLLGCGIAGGIIALFGTQSAILIDIITFFASAFILSFIKLVKENLDDIKKESYFTTFKNGYKYINSKGFLKNIIVMAIILNILLVPINSFLAVIAKDIFHQGTGIMSTITVGLMIGMMIASSLFPYISKKMNLSKIIACFGIQIGVCYITLPILSNIKQPIFTFAVVFFIFLFFGFAVTMINQGIQIEMVKSTEQDYLSRVQSILQSTSVAAIPITSFILSILCKKVNVRFILLSCGILFTLYIVITIILHVDFKSSILDADNNTDTSYIQLDEK